MHRTSEYSDPLRIRLVVIFFCALLPEMNVGIFWSVSGSLFQAARMHIILHLGVNLMLDFFLLQLCLRAGGPLLDNSVNYGTSITALLARRLVEFFYCFSTSASDSVVVPSASRPAWPAPALPVESVGIAGLGSSGHLESYPPDVDSQTCTYMSEPCTYIVRTCTYYFRKS